MDDDSELIIPILEILEIEVSNILYNLGNIGNLSFSISSYPGNIGNQLFIIYSHILKLRSRLSPPPQPRVTTWRWWEMSQLCWGSSISSTLTACSSAVAAASFLLPRAASPCSARVLWPAGKPDSGWSRVKARREQQLCRS